MKSHVNYKPLVLAILLVIGSLTSCFAQERASSVPQKCLPLSRYDSLLIAVAEGNQALVEAFTYKEERDKLKKEVDRKEGVIVYQIEKNKTARQLIDTLSAQVNTMTGVITNQEQTIRRLGTKPKMWNVSLVAGYGYHLSGALRQGPFIGISLGRTLFRF